MTTKIEYRVTGEINIPDGEPPIVRNGGWKASKDTALEERTKVGSPLYHHRTRFDRFFLETRTITTETTKQELDL